MLPEIYAKLCVRDDVVAVRVSGEKLTADHLKDEDSRKHKEAIMQIPQLRDARFLVLDMRNFETITSRFLRTSIGLHRILRQKGCQVVLLCSEDIREVLVITQFDKLFPVILDEVALQDVLDNAVAEPIFVARSQA